MSYARSLNSSIIKLYFKENLIMSKDKGGKKEIKKPKKAKPPKSPNSSTSAYTKPIENK